MYNIAKNFDKLMRFRKYFPNTSVFHKTGLEAAFDILSGVIFRRNRALDPRISTMDS